MRRSIFMTLTIVSLSACSGDIVPDSNRSNSSDASAPQGSFIGAEKLAPPPTSEPLEAKDADLMLAGLNFLSMPKITAKLGAALAGVDQPAPNENKACAVKEDSMVVSEDNKSLVMNYNYDDSTCPEVKDKFLNKMQVFINIRCASTDLSSYAGRSVRDFIYTNGASDFCSKDSAQQTLINARYEKIGNGKSAIVTGGLLNESGGFCNFTAAADGRLSANGCLFFQRVDVNDLNSDTSTTTKFIKLSTDALSGIGGQRYYDQGKMHIVLNNWTGDMLYTSGSTAPTYTLENDALKIKGSLEAGIYETVKK